MADLLDPLAALPDDGASQLQKQNHTEPIENGLGSERIKFSLRGNRCPTHVFWDCDLCRDDRASDITV